MTWGPTQQLPPDDVVAVPLGARRVLHIQRHGDVVRLSSGFVVARAASPALHVVGTLTVPLAKIAAVLRAVRRAVRTAKRKR